MPRPLRFLNGARKHINPLAHHKCDAIANRAAPAVEFERSSGEEAAAGENALFHVGYPEMYQFPKPRHAFRFGKSGAHDALDENSASGVDGSELELFLRSEMSEQSALAHVEDIGQMADGESVEAVNR